MAKKPVGEFDLIARHFAPLAAKATGAFGLTDDAAVLDLTGQTVVTTDMMVEGMHFLPESDMETVARKLLRVNLSDLAAMGAKPVAYTLALAVRADGANAVAEAFARGLKADQEAFCIDLVGGDTVATTGPLSATITAFGEIAPKKKPLRRSGAKAGDGVYVSGVIGDAVLGLKVLKGELSGLSVSTAQALVLRHSVPEPRTALGQALLGVASACVDVSDGLVQDVGHIATTSGVAIKIDADAVPVSDATRSALDLSPDLLATVMTGGDDYELAFTVSESNALKLAGISKKLGLPLTLIGRVVDGKEMPKSGVRVLDKKGKDITPARGGFSHF